MYESSSLDRLPEALVRAGQIWEEQHARRIERERAFTIAISREEGTSGVAVARAVGQRLGWPVYDRELLELLARELNVPLTAVESADERHVTWLQEMIEVLGAIPAVGQAAYVRHLVHVVFSLAAKGACVIVGRGASHVLSARTTLRVRVVANWPDRVVAVEQEQGLSHRDALRQLEQVDRERERFLKEHIHHDPRDPHHFDLVLNGSRFSVDHCADLIVDALSRAGMQPDPVNLANANLAKVK